MGFGDRLDGGDCGGCGSRDPDLGFITDLVAVVVVEGQHGDDAQGGHDAEGADAAQANEGEEGNRGGGGEEDEGSFHDVCFLRCETDKWVDVGITRGLFEKLQKSKKDFAGLGDVEPRKSRNGLRLRGSDAGLHAMKNSVAWALIPALLALAGCSAPTKIFSESAEGLDVTGYQTFYFVPLPSNPGPEVKHAELVKRLAPLVQTQVRDVMLAKGFSPATSAESADLVVLMHGDLTPKSTVLIDQSFRPNPFAEAPIGRHTPGVVHRDDYHEGRLIVEVHDVAADRMVWVAWLERRVDKGETLDSTRIATNVGRLLQRLPGRE